MVSSGLIDNVDVNHFRLSIHLIIAFLILSLIFWNYLKLKISTVPQYKSQPNQAANIYDWGLMSITEKEEVQAPE